MPPAAAPEAAAESLRCMELAGVPEVLWGPTNTLLPQLSWTSLYISGSSAAAAEGPAEGQFVLCCSGRTSDSAGSIPASCCCCCWELLVLLLCVWLLLSGVLLLLGSAATVTAAMALLIPFGRVPAGR